MLAEHCVHFGTERNTKKLESVMTPCTMIIVWRFPYLSTNKPNGISSMPQIRYGTVTNMPVEFSGHSYYLSRISVPIAIVVSIIEKVSKQSIAISQKPFSNIKSSCHLNSASLASSSLSCSWTYMLVALPRFYIASRRFAIIFLSSFLAFTSI
jgi:hypothetical protein